MARLEMVWSSLPPNAPAAASATSADIHTAAAAAAAAGDDLTMTTTAHGYPGHVGYMMNLLRKCFEVF